MSILPQIHPAPLVSTVIPAYNAEATILRAVESALAQDHPPHEIIVVENGSDDRTADVVRCLGHERVRLISLRARVGAARARNIGIEQARGELIAFLDADDEWLPGKLQRQTAMMVANEGLVFAACGAREIDTDGTDLGPLYEGAVPPSGPDAWRSLLESNTIATPTVLARREALRALGGFDHNLHIGEDQDMWLRLSMKGELGYVDEVLVIVHATPGSLSSRGFIDDARYTYPMILRHLAARRAELSGRERNAILCRRLAHLGRAAYSQGHWYQGLILLGRAMLRGHRVRETLLFLLSAAPPARRMKAWGRRLVG